MGMTSDARPIRPSPPPIPTLAKALGTDAEADVTRNGLESIANELDLTAFRLSERLQHMADSMSGDEFRLAANLVNSARRHIRKMMSAEDREETS